tara:strand:+ start:1096 stop:1398 length:303 start_codon:yes stop_codon:yes gene_type:complete
MPYAVKRGYIIRALHDEKLKEFVLADFNMWAAKYIGGSLVFSDYGRHEKVFDTEQEAFDAVEKWAVTVHKKTRIPLLTPVPIYKSSWVAEKNSEKSSDCS